MSSATILGFGVTTDLGGLSFPDLESRFEKYLEQIKSVTDLDRLIRSVKPLFQDNRYSSEELMRLKKLRQRAYDRKRNLKVQMPESVSPFGTKPKMQLARSAKEISKRNRPKSVIAKDLVPKKPLPETGVVKPINAIKRTMPEPKAGSFVAGTLRAFSSIDSATASTLAWFATACLVSFFLWHQSLALYESAEFANSFYAASGGILMIIGFAAYHSITRSWLALFFCIYAGAFEGYLIISGTIHDDNQTHAAAVQNDPQLIFLQEKADKERSRYHELKQRYDNPESKVFKNDWFLKTNLNPAWEVSAQAQQELVIKKAAMLASSNAEHLTWLKILYRLGLVFLCMMLVHRFFATCTGAKPVKGRANA
jgi:hypothetical protein